MSTFTKAERKQAKLRILITGPSGAGKTFSALLIASGIGKRIAVADSENRSASICADRTEGPLAGLAFDIMDIEPPYTVDKFTAAIDAAIAAKYDVLLLDSISHEWAGEGGLLSKKEALDQRGGNSYTNWAGISKEHEIFKARLINADIHLICTARSKQDYVLEMNDKGKQAPKKVGLAPIQREGMEYEFTTVFDLAMDHNAVASKDRTSLFDGQIFKPSIETGKKIMAWLMGGKPVQKPGEQPKEKPAEKTTETTISQGQIKEINEAIRRVQALGITEKTLWKGLRTKIKRSFAETSELTVPEGAVVLEYLTAWESHLNANGKGKGA
ncbi:MAG: AAA family ATPase [Candidatus Aminicenantales bacterium]